MRRRTFARECALQMLYQIDLRNRKLMPEDCAEEFWSHRHGDGPAAAGTDTEVKDFAMKLVKGVTEKIAEVDAEIERSAEHWKIDRMALVDRNILRIGVCEIIFFSDIPSKVTINEAVELAKKFGDSESPKFVNGVLDKIARTHKPCE